MRLQGGRREVWLLLLSKGAIPFFLGKELLKLLRKLKCNDVIAILQRTFINLFKIRCR
jgi:hypothetical protein